MDMEKVDELAESLVAASKGIIPTDETAKLEAMIEDVDPDIAIKWALDCASEGLWTLPDVLVQPVREWGADGLRKSWRDSANRALIAANQPPISGIAPTHLVRIPIAA